jgi:hypothetical protein
LLFAFALRFPFEIGVFLVFYPSEKVYYKVMSTIFQESSNSQPVNSPTKLVVNKDPDAGVIINSPGLVETGVFIE